MDMEMIFDDMEMAWQPEIAAWLLRSQLLKGMGYRWPRQHDSSHIHSSHGWTLRSTWLASAKLLSASRGSSLRRNPP